MTRVGIIGASGYAAADLMRLILGHPAARITALADLPDKCGPLSKLFPQFAGRIDVEVVPADVKAMAAAWRRMFAAAGLTILEEKVFDMVGHGYFVLR